MPASKAAVALADKRAQEAGRLKRQGCKPKEIAARLGITKGGVWSLLKRAERLEP
jgi:DNA-binding CsgD family transcriptional regulator